MYPQKDTPERILGKLLGRFVYSKKKKSATVQARRTIADALNNMFVQQLYGYAIRVLLLSIASILLYVYKPLGVYLIYLIYSFIMIMGIVKGINIFILYIQFSKEHQFTLNFFTIAKTILHAEILKECNRQLGELAWYESIINELYIGISAKTFSDEIYDQVEKDFVSYLVKYLFKVLVIIATYIFFSYNFISPTIFSTENFGYVKSALLPFYFTLQGMFN